MYTGKAISRCGRAGQPGNVFLAGEQITLTPATNLPEAGYFVGKGEDTIFLPNEELSWFVDADTISTIICDSYDNECPDCDQEIPPDVSQGDSCSNCGHVFTLPGKTNQ